jgi:hypothetical protein
MNPSFKSSNHTWSIQVGEGAIDSDYDWNSAVPIAWHLLDLPAARIKPPRSSSGTFARAAWWTPALHLLGLGLGWSDIGKGLAAWREAEYSTENQVLRFVFNTYGPAIEALEIWSNNLYGTVLPNTLHMLQVGTASFQGPWAQHPREAAAYEFAERSHSGHRHLLASEMLVGGSDSLHLADHFIDSIAIDRMQLAPLLAGQSTDAASNSNLHLNGYRGWAQYLSRNFSSTGGHVEIFIDSVGYMGRFRFHPVSGRWYRVDKNADHSRTLHWHMLGN